MAVEAVCHWLAAQQQQWVAPQQPGLVFVGFPWPLGTTDPSNTVFSNRSVRVEAIQLTGGSEALDRHHQWGSSDNH